MNNIFDIKRFSLLVKKDFAENWKKYLMTFLSMFGILSIVFLFNSWNHYGYGYNSFENHNESLFIIGMILFLAFGCMSASQLMDPIKDKTKKIGYLMNPASSFEKYFMRWLFMVVLFMVLYIIAFFMADFVQWLVCSIRYPGQDVRSIDWSRFIKIGDDRSAAVIYDRNQLKTLIVFYFYMQSLFILGSTFWQKSAFIKTFCAGFLIVTLYFAVCGGLISIFSHDDINDFMQSIVPEEHKIRDRIFNSIAAIFSFFAIVNWVIGYFRFKETEITKRL